MNGVGVLNKKTPSPGLWLSWVGRCPMHPKVLGSIPGWGACGRQPSNVSPPPPRPALSQISEKNVPQRG